MDCTSFNFVAKNYLLSSWSRDFLLKVLELWNFNLYLQSIFTYKYDTLMFKIQSAKDTVNLEVITDIASYLSYTRFPRKQMMISV